MDYECRQPTQTGSKNGADQAEVKWVRSVQDPGRKARFLPNGAADGIKR
jgi:hypothetical protein